MLFELETQLEWDIASDPLWLAGTAWGQPRSGHPEGKVLYHIAEVLGNIDRFFEHAGDRPKLRLIALIHDSFKYQATASKNQGCAQSHGYLARQFAERYINDAGILTVIELHDKVYKAWRLMDQHGDRVAAEQHTDELIAQLGQYLDLFMRFYLCDSRTGDKSTTHYKWFRGWVEKQKG